MYEIGAVRPAVPTPTNAAPEAGVHSFSCGPRVGRNKVWRHTDEPNFDEVSLVTLASMPSFEGQNIL